MRGSSGCSDSGDCKYAEQTCRQHPARKRLPATTSAYFQARHSRILIFFKGLRGLRVTEPAGCSPRHGGARQEAPRPGRLTIATGQGARRSSARSRLVPLSPVPANSVMQRAAVCRVLVGLTHETEMSRFSEQAAPFSSRRSGSVEMAAQEHATILTAREILSRQINRNPVLTSWAR